MDGAVALARQASFLAVRTSSNTCFGFTVSTANRWWFPFIDAVHATLTLEAHQTPDSPGVFEDRLYILLLHYLLGDGFWTSSGDVALLAWYVSAFTLLPSEHKTNVPILV
jgi:hypothetical protein